MQSEENNQALTEQNPGQEKSHPLAFVIDIDGTLTISHQ